MRLQLGGRRHRGMNVQGGTLRPLFSDLVIDMAGIRSGRAASRRSSHMHIDAFHKARRRRAQQRSVFRQG